jgi:hypothetical protein
MQIAQLRSEPQVVSKGNYQAVFSLREDNGPLEYVQNSFEDQGDVIVDWAIGLTWQKSGSMTVMTYDDAQEYLQSLNDVRFAGLTTWRLPTIPELLSLLEPELQPNMLYISPIFDETQMWCWSADRLPIEEIAPSSFGWRVGFRHGHVWLHDLIYVRGVCSGTGRTR